MTLRLMTLLGLLCGSCTAVEEDAQLRALQRAVSEHSAQLDQVRQRVQNQHSQVAEILASFARARMEFESAARLYREARSLHADELVILRSARASYEEAVQRWHVAQALIVAAAAFDASHLDANAWRGGRFGGSCSDGMSTAAFRALLGTLGVSLVGMHIDHIVPRAMGGADHPLNYQILPRELNQSLGASWGPDKCALAGAAACRDAVSISRACGSFRGGVPSL